MASPSVNDRRDEAPAPGGAESLPKTVLALLLAKETLSDTELKALLA